MTAALKARMLRQLLFQLSALPRKVRKIETGITAIVSVEATEPFWVTHYGAIDIDPRYLVYWICVHSDAERDRLAANHDLIAQLRELLTIYGYPAESRQHVHIGFESQETVNREAGGNWFYYWK
jgi:hypothetical protein